MAVVDVAVLGGGPSAEHEVSLRSATEVARHLRRDRWRCWPVFIGRDGRWHLPDQPSRTGDAAFAAPIGAGCSPAAGFTRLIEERGVGVVFPALHGAGGEDGTLQGMLELHGIPFVGSGTAASAVAMDKLRTRDALCAHGVAMAPAFRPRGRLATLDPEAEADAIVAAVGLPCFLKVDLSGSSFGVARAATRCEVVAFLTGTRGGRVVAEAEVRGQEISVPVLGNSGAPLRVLPAVGIRPLSNVWFDGDAKYRPGAAEEVIPPPGLDASALAAVARLAEQCHEILGCDGLSRTDMIVTDRGQYVLEINTLPGMTPESLLPKAAAAAGLGFEALLDTLLDLAIERAEQRRAEAGA